MTEMISHRPRIKKALAKLTNLNDYYDSLSDPRYMGEGYIPRFISPSGVELNTEEGEFVFTVDYYAQFREYGNLVHGQTHYYE